MRLRPILAALAGLTLVLGLVACGDDGDGDASGGGGPDAGAEGPEMGEHWHVAYSFVVCGETLEPAADRGADALGIHTHSDGLIHVHPFLAAAAGRKATFGAFLDQIGASMDDQGLELADGRPSTDDCDGGDALRVGQWDSAIAAAEGAEPDRIITDDVEDIVLAPDLSALTVVVGGADDPIPAPPSSTDICALAAADGPTADSSACGDGNGSLTETVPASTALESAAGKACVAMTGDAGDGAPEVDVPVGPPPADLVVEDLVVGDGAVAAEGDAVTVDYVGVACSTGEVFDSSYRSGEPATFDLTPGSLIEGFATGLEGLAVGGRRLLVIPPAQAYGSQGSGGVIAPDETLVFVVDLRDVATP